MHRLRSSDPAQHFAMLYTAWERLSVGGVRRLRHTIPPIAFAALHIARQKAEAGSGQPSAQEVTSMPTAKLYRLLSHCAQQLYSEGLHEKFRLETGSSSVVSFAAEAAVPVWGKGLK